MEEQKRAPEVLRMRGSLAQLVALGEDSTTVSAEVNLEISQGAARTVRIAVPVSLTVNTVADSRRGAQGGEFVPVRPAAGGG
jgi:hypothetical protein